MTKSSLLLFFLLSFIIANAQNNFNTNNLVVSKNDLAINEFPQDSTANAFYIYEKGYSRVENGGNYDLLTDYQAKIKFLNKKDLHKATVQIFLYNNDKEKERIKNIKAHTYNLDRNNNIVKKSVTPTTIYKERYNDHYTIVKFTFPDVQPGSVITYTYQKESPFIFNFEGWDFQDDIPKLYSEYQSDLPGNYIYNIKLVGNLMLDYNDSKLIKNCITINGYGSAHCARNIYKMKNIPAFIEENYLTSKKNYLSRVAYELSTYKGFDGTVKKYTKSWKDVDRDLKNHISVGVQLKKINAVKNILPIGITSKKHSLAKAKEIYQYITNHYTWDKKLGIYNDISVRDMIKNKTGNVSEINILLHNVLKQQKFAVTPVLLSTRENGFATQVHPVLTDFNYQIVRLSIDGKDYLLDATEKALPFGEVPFRCLNRYGRLLDFKNGSSWIGIKPKIRSFKYYKDSYTINDSLQIKAVSTYAYQGYHAYDKRAELSKYSKQKYISNVGNQMEEVTVENVVLNNIDKKEKPFEEVITHSSKIESNADLLFFNPFSKHFFQENPLKLTHRTYPIDFGFKDSFSHLVSITLPEGYIFEELPENKKYSIPSQQASVSLYRKQEGNILQLSLRIDFKSHIYKSKQYESLKTLFSHIIDIQNNTVILIKKDL